MAIQPTQYMQHTSNPRLCLIDDNPEDRAIIRRYLLQDINYHYHILEAETGAMGIELCRRIRPCNRLKIRKRAS